MGKTSLSRHATTLVALAIGAAVTALAVLASLSGPRFLRGLENQAYDSFACLRPAPRASAVPVIIDIDEASLAEIGQWPWPRHVLAELVQKVGDAGASAIGLDIVQSEPDSSSLSRVAGDLQKRGGLSLDLSGLPPEMLDNDLLFSRTIAKYPVALAGIALSEGELPSRLPRAVGWAEKKPPSAPPAEATIWKARSLLAPLELFWTAAPVGVAIAPLDQDGIIRSVPMLWRIGDRVYPSLALRVLMLAAGCKTLRLESDMGGLWRIRLNRKTWLRVDPQGSFMPVYHGRRGTYATYSARDVLSGRVGQSKLQGRIALIGSSAVGLHDIRSTPFDASTPGVEIHATIIDNIISGESRRRLPDEKTIQGITACLAGLAATLLFGLAPPLASMACMLPAVIFGWGLSWYFFSQGVWISPVNGSLTVLVAALCLLPVRFWLSERKGRQLRQAFSRYVSPEVVERIVLAGVQPLGGEQREVTLLFTDIRNFTTLSEKMPPSQVVSMLNSYFTPMTQCVKSHEGTMDKFLGDGLMAFWNAPVNVEDHPRKAVLAAIEMQRKLAELRPAFQKEFGVAIHVGAGLHTGLAHVGNMGSNELLDYTSIGDAVNLASRLEGLSKQYGVEILVSEATASRMGNDIPRRRLDRIRVKGKSEPVNIFTVFAPGTVLDGAAETVWQKGLDAYVAGSFAEAKDMFAGLRDRPGFVVAAKLFMVRCEHLLRKAPASWDGVWKYETK